jgi:hypothetical protein
MIVATAGANHHILTEHTGRDQCTALLAFCPHPRRDSAGTGLGDIKRCLYFFEWHGVNITRLLQSGLLSENLPANTGAAPAQKNVLRLANRPSGITLPAKH